MFNNLVNRLAKKPAPRVCRCRPAKSHRDCAYCGVGWDDGKVCGRCRENGIDGKLIPGTGRVICSKHKPR